MDVSICPLDDALLEQFQRLRTALWPETSNAQHREEARSLLASPARGIAFLAVDRLGTAIGFAEATLRADYVNGCETSPVAFLEGIYVLEEARRSGIARDLVRAIERWAGLAECQELASDALIDNADAHRFHERIGFEETERVVYFRKNILESA